jgi:Dehydratase family
VGLKLTLDDFQKVSDKVPFLADLKPSGKYVMEDLHMVKAQELCSCTGLSDAKTISLFLQWNCCVFLVAILKFLV